MTVDMADRIISESARERETFRHDPTLLSDFRLDNDGEVVAIFKPVTTVDPILTALAQLGACRTGASRAFISLFDRENQYIITEATQTSSLGTRPNDNANPREKFWLRGSAIPRSSGVCKQFLNKEKPADDDLEADLPVNVIPDILSDSRVMRNCALLKFAVRAYAGVTIRSRNGIDFGEYSVVMERPIREDEWGEADSGVLREISRAVVDHLISRVYHVESRRAEQKTNGIGSFVEQRSAFMDSPCDPEQDTDTETPGVKNTTDISDRAGNGRKYFGPERPPRPAQMDGHSKGGGNSNAHADPEDKDPLTVVFTNAANIIRQSIDADGVVFFDAGAGSFNFVGQQFTGNDTSRDTSSEGESWSSSDSYTESSCMHNGLHVIASSVSKATTTDEETCTSEWGRMCFKALSALLRRYPGGIIFDLDEDGRLHPANASVINSHSTADAVRKNPKLRKRRTISFIGNIGSEVSKSFPGARSVAFVPVWDQIKKRWRAGCFAYTFDRARFFTMKGDISYLRAFATLAMAEIANLETQLTNQAQTDVLSSLSHELRSPLHGIILGVEFLTDTPLSAFQGNVLHILENCGRTLSDTIDHLLYYAKVNNYLPPGKSEDARARGLRKEMNYTLQAGMKAITAPVRVDALVEEVTESIFAGFNFQRMSIGQLERDRRRSHADVSAMRRSDNLQAAEDLGDIMGQDGQSDNPPKRIIIDLAIEPGCSHYYYGISGAIRRILMNLFGNALKYTTSGSIRLALSQKPISSKKARNENLRWAKIVVTDTGKGIGEEFLVNHLYQEFKQEDPINPGLGLGLCMVRKIVSSLRGRVSIESQVSVGTTATVMLPLQLVSRSSDPPETPSVELDDYMEHKRQLRGLRVCLVCFDEPLGLPKHKDRTDNRQSIWNVCRRDLAMEVVTTTEAMVVTPDIVLCEEAALRDSSVTRGGLSKPPRVVVCVNALSAYHLSLESRVQDASTITEFISQPTGPRKLAKILVVALQQWVERQNGDPSRDCKLPLNLTRSRNRNREKFDARERPHDAAMLAPGPFGSPRADEGRRRPRSPSLSPRSSPRPGARRGVSPLAPPLLPLPLPAPPPAPREKEQEQEQEQEREQGQEEQEQREREQAHEFLLVEDNAINMRILCAYMRKLGQRYVTAEDGQEAVDRFRERPGRFGCVLMDINMPRLDGLQATRRLREFEAARGLPPSRVIALTGLASAAVRQEARESGVDLFLTKPVRLHEISQVLREGGLTAATAATT